LRRGSASKLQALHEPEAAGAANLAISELDREPLYETELLRMYRQRMWLVAILGVMLLPLFTIFYGYVSPATERPLLKVQGAMAVVFVAIALICPLVRSLSAARILSLTGYALYCAGAAVVITVVSQNGALSDANNRSLQFTELASYVHLLLSILLMPYSLTESLVVVLLISGSVSWGLYWTSAELNPRIFAAQVFVFGITAFLVLCISELQNVLRRRVFDSSFELAHQAARLQEMTATDSLTGGYNRRHVESLLMGELTRAARFEHPVSLLMFDLDNFKPVNDTLGHAAGDEVLREVHGAALDTLREVDTLARFGGDEFLIVLPETDAPAARLIAQRVRNATTVRLRDHFGSGTLPAKVTLSMGLLTLSGDKPVSVNAALSRVDAILYDAKRGGKNCISVG